MCCATILGRLPGHKAIGIFQLSYILRGPPLYTWSIVDQNDRYEVHDYTMNNYTPHKFNNLEDIDKSLEMYNLPKLNHEKIKKSK